MVLPPVREAVDATVKVETLPRGENCKAMLVEVSGSGLGFD